MAAIKGFLKLFCEVCQKQTWHYHERLTLPTEHCGICNKPKKSGWMGITAQVEKSEKPNGNRIQKEETYLVASRTYNRSKDNLLTELGIDDGVVPTDVDYDKVICSFCQKPTSRILSYSGISKLSIAKRIEVVCAEPLVEMVVSKVSASKVTACPDCVGNIRPLTHIINGKEEIKLSNSSGYSEG